MAKLRINGDTSGYVDITVPTVAGERTLDVVNPSFAGSVTARDTVNLINTAAATGTEWTSISNYSDGNFVIARRNDDGSYRGNVLVGWADGSTGLATGNNGTERLRIDTSGRVIMPYQPAFLTTCTSGTHTTNVNTVLDFNSSVINKGLHFNTSTYAFTAPVSGIYYFYFILYVQNGANIKSIAFRKNGSEYSILDTQIAYQSSTNIGDFSLSASTIMNLSSNDYVQIGVRSVASANLQWYGGHSWFMGYFLG